MSKYTTTDKRVLRARRRRAKRLAAIAFCAVFVLGISFGIVKVIETFSSAEGTGPLLDPTQTQGPNTSLEPQGEWDSFTGPIQQTINFEIISPELSMIQVTENGRVELSYFDDAVFVGDSLADGFRVYRERTGMVNSTFITAKSTTPRSFTQGGYITKTNNDGSTEVVHGFTAIAEANPKKVYVTLGTNALMSMTDEDLISSYYEFVDQLKTYVPNALIYITSIPPAAATKSTTDSRLDIGRTYEINRKIAKMCSEKGLSFINLYDVLKSSSGYLREDISWSDGIHLTPQGYGEWADYLISHTVYDPNSPYVPGSPYYVG